MSEQAAEELAREFHDIYERLAPDFGYETRKETRQFDPTTPNGRLMIAVCAEILSRGSYRQSVLGRIRVQRVTRR